MKHLILLLVTSFSVAVAQTRGRDIGHQCLEEIGLDEAQLRTLNFDDSEELKEFAVCMAKKSGYMNAEGELQSEYIKQDFLKRKNNDEAAANELFDTCVVKKDTPTETAVQMFKCLMLAQ